MVNTKILSIKYDGVTSVHLRRTWSNCVHTLITVTPPYIWGRCMVKESKLCVFSTDRGRRRREEGGGLLKELQSQFHPVWRGSLGPTREPVGNTRCLVRQVGKSDSSFYLNTAQGVSPPALGTVHSAPLMRGIRTCRSLGPSF